MLIASQRAQELAQEFREADEERQDHIVDELLYEMGIDPSVVVGHRSDYHRAITHRILNLLDTAERGAGLTSNKTESEEILLWVGKMREHVKPYINSLDLNLD